MNVEIKRIVKSGFVNFVRGGVISWVAVFQVVNTLAMIVAIILLQTVLRASLTQIQNKVDVTIYFTADASTKEIKELEQSLSDLPEVAEVTYVSAEDALKTFEAAHQGDTATLQALKELEINGTKVNPLSAYLNVKAKEVGQYESIQNFMKSDNALVAGGNSIIDHTNYYKNKAVLDRLNSIILGAKQLGALLTVYLIISSILITFNTIRLTIYISKEEIGVMQLVGASKMRVRGPFMIEGAIYGIIATVVVLLLFWPITLWLGNHMTEFLGINVFDYYLANFIPLAVVVLLSGIILGMFSSYLAVKKYLNK